MKFNLISGRSIRSFETLLAPRTLSSRVHRKSSVEEFVRQIARHDGRVFSAGATRLLIRRDNQPPPHGRRLTASQARENDNSKLVDRQSRQEFPAASLDHVHWSVVCLFWIRPGRRYYKLSRKSVRRCCACRRQNFSLRDDQNRVDHRLLHVPAAVNDIMFPSGPFGPAIRSSKMISYEFLCPIKMLFLIIIIFNNVFLAHCFYYQVLLFYSIKCWIHFLSNVIEWNNFFSVSAN